MEHERNKSKTEKEKRKQEEEERKNVHKVTVLLRFLGLWSQQSLNFKSIYMNLSMQCCQVKTSVYLSLEPFNSHLRIQARSSEKSVNKKYMKTDSFFFFLHL